MLKCGGGRFAYTPDKSTKFIFTFEIQVKNGIDNSPVDRNYSGPIIPIGSILFVHI